jgi:hypothetical protein
MTVFNGGRVYALLCVLAWASLDAARADQLLLKNGDRVTGSIVKMDGKSVTIKSASFGVISAAWDQVESITADKPVTVVLKDGRTMVGTLATTGGRVEVAAPDTKAAVAPAEITALRDADEQKAYERLLKPGFGDLWTGTGSVGFAGTAGNAKTLTFTTGVNAARITRTDKTSLYFSAIRASAQIAGRSADTAEAVRGGISYDHNFSSRGFLNVFNDYEYDRFQNLDLRFVIGGGAGVHAVKGDRATLDLLAGMAYNHSSFNTPLTRSVGELYWGDEYNLKLNSSVTLVQSYRMFNAVTGGGTYRVNFDLGTVTRISKWLTWNVSLSDRYLSTPAPGRKSNDFLYTTGLGISFAR